MNKSPFVYKQTRQVFTMAMCEYLQHLGHRIAIWSVNPYVQVPQSRNFKIENISNENSIASLQLHDPSCILTKQDLRYVQTSKLSCLRTQSWALLEFCEKPLVVNQWQNWRTPQKKSNPEMGNQRLRTLRTSGVVGHSSMARSRGGLQQSPGKQSSPAGTKYHPVLIHTAPKSPWAPRWGCSCEEMQMDSSGGI